MASDRVFIRELRVDCVVGIYAHERERTQPLIVDVELELDTAAAAYSGRIAETCDYARVADELAAMLEFRRYELLEVAASELAAMLIGVHPIVDEVRLRLRKPEALRGRAAAAGVEIHRRASELVRMHERHEFGEVDLLHQSQEAALYLLHIDPGGTLRPDHDRPRTSDARELEWRVDGELERDGARLEGFSPLTQAGRRARPTVNVGARRATLFCCDAQG